MNIKAIACKNETYIDADRYDFLHPQFIGLVTSYIINSIRFKILSKNHV